MKVLKVVIALSASMILNAHAGHHICSPEEVGIYEGYKAQIKCKAAVADGSNSIQFYAIPTNLTAAEAKDADRLLALGMAALASGKHLSIVFKNGDTSGVDFGCEAQNCRRPEGIFLTE